MKTQAETGPATKLYFALTCPDPKISYTPGFPVDGNALFLRNRDSGILSKTHAALYETPLHQIMLSAQSSINKARTEVDVIAATIEPWRPWQEGPRCLEVMSAVAVAMAMTGKDSGIWGYGSYTPGGDGKITRQVMKNNDAMMPLFKLQRALMPVGVPFGHESGSQCEIRTRALLAESKRIRDAVVAERDHKHMPIYVWLSAYDMAKPHALVSHEALRGTLAAIGEHRVDGCVLWESIPKPSDIEPRLEALEMWNNEVFYPSWIEMTARFQRNAP